MPGDKRRRRPAYWWSQFLDGQVWVFTQGEHFGNRPRDVENFRSLLHSYIARQNRQWPPFSENTVKVETRRLQNEEGLWQVYIQAHWPYDTTNPA